MPLNYGLLMHLAEGSPQMLGDDRARPHEHELTRWERDIAERAASRDGTRHLRALCERPVLSMVELRDAAVRHCGFEHRELDSAVRFLHKSGAVLLHEGPHAGTGGSEVQGRVFMRPQWIVDAVKYVIRDAADVNDEMRELDRRVTPPPPLPY